MLFNAGDLIATTTPAVTAVMNYMLQPVIDIGFKMTLIIAVLTIAFVWITIKLPYGVVKAIGVKTKVR